MFPDGPTRGRALGGENELEPRLRAGGLRKHCRSGLGGVSGFEFGPAGGQGGGDTPEEKNGGVVELEIHPRMDGGDQQRQQDKDQVGSGQRALSQEMAEGTGKHRQHYAGTDQAQFGEELHIVVVRVFPAEDGSFSPWHFVDFRDFALVNREVVAKAAGTPAGDDIVLGHFPRGVPGQQASGHGAVGMARLDELANPVKGFVGVEKIGS